LLLAANASLKALWGPDLLPSCHFPLSNGTEHAALWAHCRLTGTPLTLQEPGQSKFVWFKKRKENPYYKLRYYKDKLQILVKELVKDQSSSFYYFNISQN